MIQLAALILFCYLEVGERGRLGVVAVCPDAFSDLIRRRVRLVPLALKGLAFGSSSHRL